MASAIPAVVGAIATSLTAKDTPKAPEVKTAPTPDSAASLAAKRRTMQRTAATSGRLGTSLTTDESKLG